MNRVLEIELALRELPASDQWEIARWLLEELHHASDTQRESENGHPAGATARQAAALPDYAARRRRIFGDKVLPNMVLTARAEERW